ncbi:MAG: hypothetical protein ACKOAL_04600, partial [Chthoniobacterales bacterium]
ADCSTVAPLTTPENECLAPADTHPTFALAGLSPDDQQRTSPVCTRRIVTLRDFSLNFTGLGQTASLV